MLKERNFLGYCQVNGTLIAIVVPATGYMKARDDLLRLAAAIIPDFPSVGISFHVRRHQVVEAGQRPDELLRVPCLSECLVRSTPTKTKPNVVFPNQFNRKYRPQQGKKDRDVFADEHLDRLAKSIRAEVARG